MATPPPVHPAEPGTALDEPDADHLDGLPFDVHAWLEAATFELDDPALVGVPFN